ncbi:hypothetical protein [Yoonia sp. BS5-3]|uniref:Uncharacterized protein n=1 Tax=Yoonia phaeophyticola TaxID=3137369 RepID=A0ABZ2V323_9RHOB
MKKLGWAVAAALVLGACSGGGGGGTLPEGAVEVTENRVDGYLASDSRRYDVRTYVVPFETPYYITLTPAGRTFGFAEAGRLAGSTAAQYIKTRGCTDTLSRLASQDVYDPVSDTWTIVISC